MVKRVAKINPNTGEHIETYRSLKELCNKLYKDYKYLSAVTIKNTKIQKGLLVGDFVRISKKDVFIYV